MQNKIDKTTYLVEVHFSATSTQSVEDKLKRVILHDLEHRKQGRPRKSDEK
ncbi:transposon-encoded TnpW family protein [Acetatifactor muris]|uniref:transposon-encoded TnpW family protein n=1 Tax=Acetatifactor muris TaxID=879566 RepID=UPI001FA84250|nr:transposon-encoded TnpW family protein [Acetatifactor muris]MCR2046990.1 transposon-encoded TnpW family protein [Acetatifactor muris]